MLPTKREAAAGTQWRREARRTRAACHRAYRTTKYRASGFSAAVRRPPTCSSGRTGGRRPILILQAPPQHGKSEIVSRKLLAYILGASRHGGVAGPADELANAMA